MAPRSLRFGLPVFVAGVLLALVGWLLWPSPRVKTPAPVSRLATPAVRKAAAPDDATPEPEREVARGIRAHYALSLERHASLNGKEVATVKVSGRWTTTDLAHGRTLAQLDATQLAYDGAEAPTREEVAAPIVLVRADGVLDRIAFAPGTTERAKELLTNVATLLQLSLKDGASWSATESDLTGAYPASYTRQGAHIARTRGPYETLREGAASKSRNGHALKSEEHTAYQVDDRGLVSEQLKLIQRADLGHGLPALAMDAQASLQRQSVEEVALTDGPDFEPEPITSHYDRAAHRRSELERITGGASAETLLAQALDAARLDPRADGSRLARHHALEELQALVQLDPTATKAISDAIQDHRDDPRFVDLTSSALAGSGSPDATNALASLVSSGQLSADALRQAVTSLGLATAPTAESMAALAGQLDGPDGNQAALALGAEAKDMGDTQPPAQDAIDQLLQRYADATDPETKRACLLALANTGSRRVLPTLEAAISGPDYGLAQVGTFGLRLIPGDDVDNLLNSLIASGSSVTVAAIQAVGYRSPAVWTSRLQQYLVVYKSQQRVVDTIKSVLSRWTAMPEASNDATSTDPQGGQ